MRGEACKKKGHVKQKVIANSVYDISICNHPDSLLQRVQPGLCFFSTCATWIAEMAVGRPRINFKK